MLAIKRSFEGFVSISYFVIPFSILLIALFSRLYNLSIFPYFHIGLPMCGGIPTNTPSCTNSTLVGLPGLYDDEVASVLLSHSASGILSNTDGGPVAAFLIALSSHIFGINVFSVRLPFAIVSSFSSLMVYFVSYEITHGNKTLSILSSLYFVVMMPALVYGRMAMAENIIALFFIITFYSLMKIRSENENEKRTRFWLLVASIFSALSIIVKLDGAFVLLYFLLFLYKSRLLRKSFLYVGLSIVLGMIFPIGLVQVFTGQATYYLGTVAIGFFTQIGHTLGIYRAFFLDSLPSGVPIFWASTTQSIYSGLVTPEFWYVILYICLALLIFHDFANYDNLLLAIGTFLVFISVFSGAFGDYWIVMIQPVLAVAFGPGLKRLLQAPLSIALCFYTFLYLPLITSLDIFLFAPSNMGSVNIQNDTLLLWNLLLVIPLAVLMLVTARMHASGIRWRKAVNGVLILAFFVALLLATYFLPILYPYYI